jgi:hypothetical protein
MAEESGLDGGSSGGVALDVDVRRGDDTFLALEGSSDELVDELVSGYMQLLSVLRGRRIEVWTNRKPWREWQIQLQPWQRRPRLLQTGHGW